MTWLFLMQTKHSKTTCPFRFVFFFFFRSVVLFPFFLSHTHFSHSSLLIFFVSSFPDLNSSVSYQATKGALNSISRFYALKLARFGIRVNSLSPFFFVSDRNKGFYNSDATWQDFIEKQIPLSRNFQIEELFPKLDFLLSTDSSFITGQNLNVDGGATLRIYP